MRCLHCRRLALTLVTAGLAGLALTPLPALTQELKETKESIEPAIANDPAPGNPVPVAAPASIFQGALSYYASAFAGRRTSNGERYIPDLLTMAHRTLQFGTLVRVTNLHNNLSVVVRVNDRGPFTGGRVGDVSAGAARLLGMLQAGVVPARFEVLGSGESPAGR